MGTLALIGLVGGLITGISPCILPVLPVIFFSGTSSTSSRSGRQSKQTASEAKRPGTESASVDVAVDDPPVAPPRFTARPFLVIAGLVVSFATFTLVGSALLSLLGLPQDALRWIGLVALILIGIGLIVPRFEELLERPFSWIPRRQVGTDRSGFVLGLAIGTVYVPCAGPVLAAIAVAGATGEIGIKTVVLTVSFTVGAAIPLLFFAFAGEQISQRLQAFRRHQRTIRIVSGVVMILLAVALVLNIPQLLQRAVPDYTTALQQHAGSDDVQQKLKLTGLTNDENKDLDKCTPGADVLQSCGKAPGMPGIDGWFNTPGNAPIDLKSLHGKVVLLDFWAYSCINCQRSIPHVEGWYDRYRQSGLEVIGVHSPEYAFEKVPGNVMAGAQHLHITYPVALDTRLSTWTNYRNSYWPADYLIDADGTVRHIQFGEGDYDGTEKLIRQLLTDANPSVRLPKPIEIGDTTPQESRTPESYLGYSRVSDYSGQPTPYVTGSATFTVPPNQPADSFALRGRWDIGDQSITAQAPDSGVSLKYHARNAYLVVGGNGTVTETENGTTRQIPISGPPTLHPLHTGNTTTTGQIDLTFTPGLEGYSFTFG